MRANLFLALGVFLLVVGVALLVEAVTTGEAHFALLLFIPVIYGGSILLAGGAFLMIIGLFLAFSGFAATVTLQGEGQSETPSHRPEEPLRRDRRVSYGGFLVLGPVPIIFGNRPSWLPYLIAMALVTLLAIMLFIFLI